MPFRNGAVNDWWRLTNCIAASVVVN